MKSLLLWLYPVILNIFGHYSSEEARVQKILYSRCFHPLIINKFYVDDLFTMLGTRLQLISGRDAF